MNLIILAFSFLAATAQATPVPVNSILVCKGNGKTVTVYPSEKNFEVEVDDGKAAVVVATGVKYQDSQDFYVGRITEKTELEKFGFTIDGPLTLKSDSLIVQDPYTGSASVVWNGLNCETRQVIY